MYLCTGFYQPKLLAVRVDGKGDVTSSHLQWKTARGTPLTPSPMLVGDEIYMVSDNGMCRAWMRRLGKKTGGSDCPGSYSASPVFADGRIYLLNESGETTVIAPGKDFRKLASKSLKASTSRRWACPPEPSICEAARIYIKLQKR